jgi:hypothetical protein
VIHSTSAKSADVRFEKYAENVGIQAFRTIGILNSRICLAIGGWALLVVATQEELGRPQVMTALEDLVTREASGVL